LPTDFSAYSLRYRLERLLRSGEIRTKVKALSREMQAEPGVVRSAEMIEALL